MNKLSLVFKGKGWAYTMGSDEIGWYITEHSKPPDKCICSQILLCSSLAVVKPLTDSNWVEHSQIDDSFKLNIEE